MNEGAGSVTLFVVLLEGTLEREVNLQFLTVGGTAMASGIVKIIIITCNTTSVQFRTCIVMIKVVCFQKNLYKWQPQLAITMTILYSRHLVTN